MADNDINREPVACPHCGRHHVMGCDYCGADLDITSHYADCPEAGKSVPVGITTDGVVVEYRVPAPVARYIEWLQTHSINLAPASQPLDIRLKDE